MAIRGYGYQVRKVEVTSLMMAEVKDVVLQAMVKNNAKDNLVRLVNITTGEVTEYDGMDALILAELNNRYEVNVISIKQIHLNFENRDVIVVVFDDDIENEV